MHMDSSFEKNYAREQEIRRMHDAAQAQGSREGMADAYWKGWRRSTARTRKQVQISMKRFMGMFSASGRGCEDICYALQKGSLGGVVYGSCFYK